MTNRHWFALKIDDNEIRKMNRDTYYKVTSWLRWVRRFMEADKGFSTQD